jgi:hypothetical protein
MYLCYLDESGTPDLPGTSSHFILAGISIPSNCWKFCDSQINEAKKKYGLDNAEIHTAWMLRSYREQRLVQDFETKDYHQRRADISSYRKAELLRLQRSNVSLYRQCKKNFRLTENYIHLTRQERKQLLIEVSEIIRSWDFSRLFAECIDKVYFDPVMAKNTIEEQSFEQIVSRFEQYLQITSHSCPVPNMGMLIHDNNPTMSNNLTALMIKFHTKGTLWTKVTNIIETPLFVDSKLTGMVQIADLCCYALRRYLENAETELFSNIFSRADKKDGRVVGVRHYTKPGCRCYICTSR